MTTRPGAFQIATGTPTEDQVPAITSGVPTWADQSGGGIAEFEITATLTADADDYYSPTGWDTATHVELDTDGSNWSIAGFAAPSASGAKRKTVVNADAANTITLEHENSGTETNDIVGPGTDLVLGPGDIVRIIYSTNISKWRIY